MYLVGFVFAMWLATRRANRPGSGWTKNEVENLLYAGFLGVFLGGRIGYVLFYNLPVFLTIRCICSASGTAACRSTAA
jgi:phosphatidylglycerol:prolipoprotein diacylglycerol transferase